MKRFPWLFLDDDKQALENAKGLSIPNSTCTAVSDVDQIQHEIIFGFHLLAVVDLWWNDEKASLGMGFIQDIRRFQPLCECIVSSRVIGANLDNANKNDRSDENNPYSPQNIAQDLSRCFGAVESRVTSFLPKGATEQLEAIIHNRAEKAGIPTTHGADEKPSKPTVTISEKANRNIDKWASIIFKQAENGFKKEDAIVSLRINGLNSEIHLPKIAASLKAECDYLVSHICGQGMYGSEESPIDRIDLDLLEEGKSSALVLVGQPVISGEQSGVWLVFKLDFADRIREEIRAFDKHIKFKVARGRRVELLGSLLGSRLGAICYTFVGDNPQKPVTLKTRLLQNQGNPDEKFEKLVEQLFGDPDLHAVRADSFTSIKSYFDIRLAKRETFDFQGNWPSISSDIKKLAKENKITNLKIPVDPTTTSIFGVSHNACWAHGDLHLSNIVVGHNEDVMLIDFRDTGRAPRVLDYVVLSTSLRNETAALKERSILCQNRDLLEKALLNSLLGKTVQSIEKTLAELTPDQKLLVTILNCMKRTFLGSEAQPGSDQLSKLYKEYIACSFAWGCIIYTKLQNDASMLSQQRRNSSGESDVLLSAAKERVYRQKLALGLHLCFLGSQMEKATL